MARRWVLLFGGAGVLVALAAGAWLLRPASPPQAAAEPATGAATPRGAVSKYPILIPGGDEVMSGHVRWRLISARVDQHHAGSPDEPETLELRVSLRATELMNIDTRITNDTIRLMVGGRQFSTRKPFSERLFASQSADLTDLLFVVPASSTIASLQLGTTDGPSTLLALRYSK